VDDRVGPAVDERLREISCEEALLRGVPQSDAAVPVTL
jgi:hypothetical protein